MFFFNGLHDNMKLNSQGGKSMALYRCNVCNAYDYDENEGDSTMGIEPGTQPADFPENWVCPICGSDKTHLEPG